MYKLKIITPESGKTVAELVYQEEDECFKQIDDMGMVNGYGRILLDSDIYGNKYMIPARPNHYIFLVKPVIEEC